MVGAIPEALSQRRAFEEFDAHLRRDKPEQMKQWDHEYAEWDKKSKPSPCLFDTTERSKYILIINSPRTANRTPAELSTAQIKLQLADEEAAKDGLTAEAAHTPSTFILMALEIEDLQYVTTCILKYDRADIMFRRKLHSELLEHPHPTPLQQAGFQSRRVALRKRIIQIRELQAIYMPGLRTILPDPMVLVDAPNIRAENVRLYFPSDIEKPSEREYTCVKGLAIVETRIRQGLALDNLHDLRRHLLTRTYLNKWRVKNVSGQRTSTRARTLQHSIDMKILGAKSRYRRSRNALLVLRGKGSWESVLKELHDDDVRGLNERLMTEREKAEREHRISTGTQFDADALPGVPMTGTMGEGKRTLSWIWISFTGDENSPEMVEGEHFSGSNEDYKQILIHHLCSSEGGVGEM